VTHPLSYTEFLARLDALGLFHMDLMLERMAAFVARHGAPRFPVLHVVGTNGKGSTATVLAELLRAHGLRVGLSVSPHFVTPRERILVDGAMLPEDTWARLGEQVLAEGADLGLTYFEVLTALSLLAFEDAGVDVAVMEAGLGGRYDATNVLSPALTVFTPIGMDHMNILGDTLEKIAADKAGAMRAGGVAVCAAQEPSALAVLRETAATVGSQLIPAEEVLYYSRANGRVQPGPLVVPGGGLAVRPMTGLFLALPGAHQEQNARTALAAFHVFAARLRLPVYEDACREAFARAFIPGRMQKVEAAPELPPALILDGGHNAHGLAALKNALEVEGVRPAAVVFGCLRDKPLADMLPLVRAIAGEARLIACGIPGCERACAPAELAAMLGPSAQPAPDVHAALALLGGESGPVLVCGSLYLLGEFYTKHPRLLEREAGSAATRRSRP
jgi:dihydrofolate synthase/folylpolyglutamate synthase